MKTGAQILLDCLKQEGVDTIFGYPGARTLLVHDALMDEKEIRHILVRHEQGAAHAADGYARTTGKVGVCLTTSGPGATNLVTGIATAYMDSVPMVALTCQVTTADIGNPPAMLLASVIRSGTTPLCSTANSLPVRPAPACTSSAMSRMPWASQTARSSCKKSNGAT